MEFYNTLVWDVSGWAYSRKGIVGMIRKILCAGAGLMADI